MHANQTQPTRIAVNKVRFGFLIPLIALLASAQILHAQNGTWTNLVNGDASGTWGTAANWNNGVIANGADNTADFSTLNILPTNSVVTLDTARTIGNLIFGDTFPDATWVLTNNTLTLQMSSGVPTITANNGSNVIFSVLAGASGFNKAGTGIIRLNGANNTGLSSNINVNAGILQVGNNNALGIPVAASTFTPTNLVVVASGATLQILPTIQQNFKPVHVSGAGVGGTQGAIYGDLSSLANNNNATRLSISLTTATNPAVTLLGDATIRVDGTNSGPLGSVILIGHITTSNALTGIPAHYTNYTLTKTGIGRFSIDPAGGYSGGNLHIVQGSIRFGNNNDLLASQTVTVDAGAGLHMGNITSLNSPNSSLVINGQLDLNSRGNGNPGSDTTVATQTIGYLSGSGSVTNGGAGNNGASTLVIGGTNGTSTTFSGRIAQPANGSISLRLQNTNSTLRLTGNNAYQGTTVLNAGTLLVNGSHVGGGAYTVNSNSVLGGNGVMGYSSAITINDLGMLSAGDPLAPGTLTVSNVLDGNGVSSVMVSNATLNCVGQIGTSGAPIDNLVVRSGTLQLILPVGGAAAFVTNFNVDTAGCVISWDADAPNLGQFPIIDYSAAAVGGSVGFSGLTLSSPAGVVATLSNNLANTSVDIVITSVPLVKWTGNQNGNWEIGGALNWLRGGIATNYDETPPGLFVVFDDSSAQTNVSLTTTLSPQATTVSNATRRYAFTGSGHLSGAGGIVKQGSGTLVVANSGINDLAGTVNINNGVVQVGNGGTSGNLGSASIINGGTLAFDLSSNVTFNNTISSAGSLLKQGTGRTTLTGIGDVNGSVLVSTGLLALAPAGTISVSGPVTGTGAFGSAGGTVVLSNSTVTYSGGTVITNGTLQFNATLPPSGNITNDGTLALATGGTLANNVSGSGGVSVLNGINLTLNGANTYRGPTLVLGSSTVDATASTYSPASPLALGSQTGSNDVGAINFTAGNPVVGGLRIGGNSLGGNPLNLTAGGQTLSINGNVSVGNIAPAGASILLQPAGTGVSLVVNTNGGTIQIGLGAAGSGVNPDNILVDFSGIDNFVANLGATGVVNLGTLDGNPGPPAGATVVNQFVLANLANSITAGTITVGAGGRQLTPELRLGPGTNILNVDALNVGTGGRDGGVILFNAGMGGLQVRGNAGGSTRANYNQGVNPTSGTGAPFITSVDFTGGTADLLFGPMVIGNEPVRVGNWTNLFTFSQGVLDATSLSMSGGRLNNGSNGITIVNITGGTANLGPVSLTASVGTGTLNISGGATVTVSNITSAGAGAATLDINNSTLNVNVQGFGNPVTAPVAVDTFNANGTVNLGVNGTGLTVGQFPLIGYAGSIGGSGFSALNLASLPAGVSGFLSNHVANLSVDLVITAAPPAVNPNPTNITFSLTVTTLNLTWPGDHLGWTLETNAAGLNVPAAWFPYPGSSSVTNVAIPVSKTKTNVFFRLVLP